MPSNQPTEAAVQAALAEFKDPETGRSITQLDQVHVYISKANASRSPWA